MSKDILGLAKKLISIKSVSGAPKALDTILMMVESVLQGYTIERFEHNGIKSILVYKDKKRPKRFKVLLNGHLDVIPAKPFQYKPIIRGNRLYGAGAMDMKANVACLIMTFKKMATRVKYPLALQLVTDEEVGGFDGTKYQIDKGVRADFMIAGEPTNFDIVHKAKRIVWIKIFAQGKATHSAYPWKADNAVWKMIDFLVALKKRYPLPRTEQWKTTINIGNIFTSNTAFNKTPDNCEVWLDIRHIPEKSDTLLKTINALLPSGFVVDVIADEPLMYTDIQNTYVRLLAKASRMILKKKTCFRGAHGSSDARHFMGVGGVGVEFGPVGDGIGSDAEWVDIPSLETYCHILQEFLSLVDGTS